MFTDRELASIQQLLEDPLVDETVREHLARVYHSRGNKAVSKWQTSAEVLVKQLIKERADRQHIVEKNFQEIKPRRKVNTCELDGKIAFESHSKARRAMKHKSARLRAYKCQHCRKWHLTKQVY